MESYAIDIIHLCKAFAKVLYKKKTQPVRHGGHDVLKCYIKWLNSDYNPLIP